MSIRLSSNDQSVATEWHWQEISQNLLSFLPAFSFKPTSIANEGVPILALPFEIIALIFEIARDTAPIHTSRKAGVAQGANRGLTITRSEVIFSHVCRIWRDVALVSPTLWSDLVHLSPNQPILLPWLAAYLERSQNTPLNLLLRIKTEMNTKRGGGGPTASNVAEVFDMLIAHASRWRCLSIILVDHWLYSLHRLLNVSAPNLEVFNMETAGSYPPGVSTKVLFRGSAPKLSGVTMDSGLFLPYPPPLTMKTLELRYSGPPYNWERFLDIISIPTLENLSITGQPFEKPTTPIQNVRPIIAHNLKVLRLFRCDTACYLWKCNVRAPRLETLAISDLTVDKGWDLPNGLPDSESEPGPFPSLKTLALSNCQISSAQRLLHLAQATSGVEHLIIQRHAERTNIIEHAIANRENPALWPRLETMTYLGLSYLGKRRYEEDTDPDIYAGLVDWRHKMFERRCVLQLERRWLSLWVDSERLKGSWKRLGEADLLEVVVYPTMLSRWPPPTDVHFRNAFELLSNDCD